MSLVTQTFGRALSIFRGKAAEGAPRPGPWSLTGGFLTPGYPSFASAANWWQLGGDVVRDGAAHMATIEACVAKYARTVAMCPPTHWRRLDNGGRRRVANSALSRIIRKPNDYTTFYNFMLDAVRCMFLNGNSFALALRNHRFEVDELHLMDPRQCFPAVTPETGEIFYQLGGNAVIDARRAALGHTGRLLVPARDVLHFRLHAFGHATPPFPLVGQTPLVSTYGSLAFAQGMLDQQANFYRNEARPSAVLRTDLNLSREQANELRDRWNEQAKGLHQGGVPILANGLNVTPWPQAPAAKDMQIAELFKLTAEDICRAFGVPMPLVGLEHVTGSSLEELVRHWLSSDLGSVIEGIEQTIDKFFGLDGQPDEYIEFDVDVLMRTAPKDRMDADVKGVQGGVFSSDEARARWDLPATPGGWGATPRVQAQNVPLDAVASMQSAPAAPAAPAAPGASSAAEPRRFRRMAASDLEKTLG